VVARACTDILILPKGSSIVKKQDVAAPATSLSASLEPCQPGTFRDLALRQMLEAGLDWASITRFTGLVPGDLES
jgi:hypothetical protein